MYYNRTGSSLTIRLCPLHSRTWIQLNPSIVSQLELIECFDSISSGRRAQERGFPTWNGPHRSIWMIQVSLVFFWPTSPLLKWGEKTKNKIRTGMKICNSIFRLGSLVVAVWDSTWWDYRYEHTYPLYDQKNPLKGGEFDFMFLYFGAVCAVCVGDADLLTDKHAFFFGFWSCRLLSL